MNRRNEILRAISKAAGVLASLPIGNRTSFDIIGAVTEREIPLLFRPLENLLGSVVAIGGVSGIMVTTKRDLHVQRFTLAHELGHILLGHQLSLDRTIEVAGRNASASRPIEEMAADTFAAELLGPKRLVLESAQRHGWTKQKFRQPDNIYQLSLRLGISYQAACWALVTSDVLTRAEAGRFLVKPVKDRKYTLAPRELITNSWANVWALTKSDSGTFLETGPDDLFVVHVQDHASAGYLWQLVETGANAEIVYERSTSPNDAYGEHSSRAVYVRFGAPGTHRLVFEHIRPWSGAILAISRSTLRTTGKSIVDSRDERGLRHWRAQHEYHHSSRPSNCARPDPRPRREADMLVVGVDNGSRTRPQIQNAPVPRVSAPLRIRRRFIRWRALPRHCPHTWRSWTTDGSRLPVPSWGTAL